jgi:uncharacterized ferritin-like protein (DUF455 family)
VRAKLLHTFFHHELQAAELMAWGILAFCDAEAEFRKGLLGIALDEIRHMNLYRAHIEKLGFRIGDFPVRDWFWERIAGCESKQNFVAFLGMGLEAANLEHAPAFAERFDEHDPAGAALQRRVANEEVGHVAFGVRWFERWTGGQDFDTWVRALPPPLTPLLMRGPWVDAEERARAGMAPAFVEALAAFQPVEA